MSIPGASWEWELISWRKQVNKIKSKINYCSTLTGLKWMEMLIRTSFCTFAGLQFASLTLSTFPWRAQRSFNCTKRESAREWSAQNRWSQNNSKLPLFQEKLTVSQIMTLFQEMLTYKATILGHPIHMNRWHHFHLHTLPFPYYFWFTFHQCWITIHAGIFSNQLFNLSITQMKHVQLYCYYYFHR